LSDCVSELSVQFLCRESLATAYQIDPLRLVVWLPFSRADCAGISIARMGRDFLSMQRSPSTIKDSQT